MSKTLAVAWREFVATAGTKGFIFGILITPLLILVVVVLTPLLMRTGGPKVEGSVAVIDRTGAVAGPLGERLTPASLGAQVADQIRQGVEQVGQALPENMQAQMEQAGAAAAAQAVASAPRLSIEALPPDADVESEKQALLGGQGAGRRLMLVVVPAGAVEAGPEGYEPPQVFTEPKLDFEVSGRVEDALQDVIVDARLARSGLDGAAVRRIMERPRIESVAVTQGGERTTSEAVQIFIPLGFMMLLWISVFTAGQYLLTSTIEEKSSRVMEVLLSAVSPMQLMVGKILGQAGVGAVIMGVYALLGLGSLVTFQFLHLLDWRDIVLLVIYFVIAYVLIAAMMAAIGSAVSDLREAQTLMTPVMIVLFVPMMLWLPIQRNPNSLFAQVLSMLPPVSPFVMVVRISGSEAIPLWQIPASILVGVLSVVFMCWAAAKIFRIGVLMYGKPPNFATLVKWIRMA